MKTIFGLLAVVMAASASPAVSVPELQARDPAVDNIVYVTDAENFWSVFIFFLSSFIEFEFSFV